MIILKKMKRTSLGVLLVAYFDYSSFLYYYFAYFNYSNFTTIIIIFLIFVNLKLKFYISNIFIY